MMRNSVKIKILMMQKGISGSHIADIAGVHRTAIYHIISGRAKSRRLQKLIAQELDWPFEALWNE
jgi:DNA-binding XRE family transcriptional regulator